MEQERNSAFEGMSIPRTLAKFIIPAVVSQLAMLILNLTDAFFVGRTGDTFQISAMTITFPVAMMVACVAMIFAAGGNANTAGALGRQDREEARRFCVFALYTAVAAVIVMSLVLLAVKDPLLYLLGADENSIGYCRGYLLWVFHISCTLLVFSQVMSQLFAAEGETRIAGMGIAGAGLINAVLDPVFIFVLDQGVVGAGMATCLANVCSALFYLVMYVRKRGTTVLSLDLRLYSPGNGICRRTLAIGVPAGLSFFLMNCCDFVRNYLLGAYGTLGGQIELAAWGTVQKVGNAFMQVGMGIALGTRPLVAYHYTAGLLRRTRELIRGTFAVTVCYTLLCFVVVKAVPGLLVGLFLPVPEAAPVAIRFLDLWIICIFGVVFLELMNSIFQAMGHWKLALADVVVSKLGLMLPLMLVLVRRWGVMGVVASQPLSENIVAAVLVLIYVGMARRMRKQEAAAH